jgi:hypothetical protein
MSSNVSEIDATTPRYGLKRVPLYVYSENTAKILYKKKKIKSFAIGAPWIYLKAQGEREDLRKTKISEESIIVFPEHTGIEDQAKYDRIAIRKRIAHWKEIAGHSSITVCLYYTDFLQNVWIQELIEAGLRPFCAGMAETAIQGLANKSRSNFLYTLRNELLRHNRAIFEEIYSSALYFSVDLGLEVGVFKNKYSATHYSKDYQESLVRYLQASSKIIPPELVNKTDNVFCKSEDIRHISDELLGKNQKLNPEDLREILKWIECHDF